MGRLQPSFAIGDYDRNRALIDGAVRVDGVDPVVTDALAGGDLLPPDAP